MPKRRRGIHLNFFVSEEEKAIIDANIERTRAGNLSNYLRQLALRGTITQIDVSAIRDLHRELGNISRDLHQIVYRAAMIQDLHEQDYRDILADYAKLRTQFQEMMSRQMHAVSQAGALQERNQHGGD